MQQPSFLLQLPFVLNCWQFHPSHQIKDHDEQIGGKEILNFKQKIKMIIFYCIGFTSSLLAKGDNSLCFSIQWIWTEKHYGLSPLAI